MRLSGPPASTTARFSVSTVASEVFQHPGCTLNATALPPASMLMAWFTMNADGELIGVMDATTPHGCQSSTANPWSPANAVGPRSSTPSVRCAAKTFFSTLSRNRPSPVSSNALRASGSAFATAAARTASM